MVHDDEHLPHRLGLREEGADGALEVRPAVEGVRADDDAEVGGAHGRHQGVREGVREGSRERGIEVCHRSFLAPADRYPGG